MTSRPKPRMLRPPKDRGPAIIYEELVAMTDCGDCPGLVLPKMGLQMTVLKQLDETVDEVYFASCVHKAHAFMNCPMNLEGVTKAIEDNLGVPVHVGTHDY